MHYDHKTSIDYTVFNEGVSITGIDINIKYTSNNKNDLKRLEKCNIIETTGPTLINNKIRHVFEKYASNAVEFFDVDINDDIDLSRKFCAINLLWVLPCCDMEKSEFTLSNFDLANPNYMFMYKVLKNDINREVDIFRCKEQHTEIVVSEGVKQACMDAGIKGLRFCTAIDLTPKNRSECVFI
ncbi:imm11 family protein [Escherichia coli]|uniref:imm11 family protein n=1 Tax=Escherichia coli TaxID=562 RepID=UPI0006A09705|nr:Uncharacterised protein [Escherichia coli]